VAGALVALGIGCDAGRRTLGHRRVLAQTFVDDLAQQVCLRSTPVFKLSDELGSHPMDTATAGVYLKSMAARPLEGPNSVVGVGSNILP
jgi:hypothetical protein